MSAVNVLTALDLLLQLLDRTSAAANLIRKARDTGGEVTLADLEAIKSEGAALLSDLNAAIEKAKAEGR